MADSRIQAVIVTAPKDLMDQIAGMMADLDVPSDRDQDVYVFQMKNGDPQQAVQVLQNMFQSSSTSRSGTSSSSQNSALQQRAQNSTTTMGTTTTTTGVGGTGTGGGGSAADGRILKHEKFFDEKANYENKLFQKISRRRSGSSFVRRD